MQLQVIVNKLNKRKSPVTDFTDKGNVIGIVTKGFTFEGAGEITNTLGTWVKDRDGSYYWGNGISEFSQSLLAISDFTDYFNLHFIPEKMSWAHKVLDIPFIWNDIQTAGEDVVVGIIDTGIDTTHDDLKFSFLSNSVHVDNNGSKDITTELLERIRDRGVGHGTQMAGIIAASGKTVYGIAPQCKLLVVRVDGDLGRTPISLAKGIDFLVDADVDLISISQTTTNDPTLKTAVHDCFNAGIPIFSAIGDNHIVGFKDIDDDTFPACYGDNFINECVAVGSFDEDLKVCDFSQRNEHLGLLAPGNENRILTTSLNNHKVLSPGETSIATAIAAGCFTLVVSFLKKKKRADIKKQALEIILKTCDDMGSVIGHDPDHGHGRINLRNALAQIKTML